MFETTMTPEQNEAMMEQWEQLVYDTTVTPCTMEQPRQTSPLGDFNKFPPEIRMVIWNNGISSD